jgi:hypothetical protein
LPIATGCRESLCTSLAAAGLGQVVDQPTPRRHRLAVNEDLEVSPRAMNSPCIIGIAE